jgi:hypothetical protein
MIRTAVLVVLAVVVGAAAAQSAKRPDPNEPKAKVPPMEYRSAFEGYRPFADQEALDWRKANEEVGAAGGHAGHRPGQGPGQPTSKPQPGEKNR